METRRPVLLFDVMDTLVTDPFFHATPAFFGLTLEELFQQKHPDSWIEFEKGKISEVEYLSSFFADGRPIDRDAFRAMLWDNYDWLPGAEELTAELFAAGYALHALSNYSCWYRIIEAKLRLSRFVEWTFVSDRTGLRKPDPNCYRYVAETLQVKPEELLFIDDRRENVEAARDVGLDAIQMEGIVELRAALKARGIEPDS